MPEIAVLTNGGSAVDSGDYHPVYGWKLPHPIYGYGTPSKSDIAASALTDFVRTAFDISPALPETTKAELTQAGLEPYRKVVMVGGLALLGVLLVVALRK